MRLSDFLFRSRFLSRRRNVDWQVLFLFRRKILRGKRRLRGKRSLRGKRRVFEVRRTQTGVVSLQRPLFLYGIFLKPTLCFFAVQRFLTATIEAEFQFQDDPIYLLSRLTRMVLVQSHHHNLVSSSSS